jgi:alkyl hydroperoxide reductase subunit AhpC
MALRINDTLPNLTVKTDQGSFSLHDFIGDSWMILFSHPKDFTPVCTTEFGAVAQLADEWESAQHQGHRPVRRQRRGAREMEGRHRKLRGRDRGFPIIADDDLAVSKAFDMLPADAYLPDGRTAADSARRCASSSSSPPTRRCS